LNSQDPAVQDYLAETANGDCVFLAVDFGDSAATDNGMGIYVDSVFFATKKMGQIEPVYEVIDIEPAAPT
jgi:hypothetical protein